MSEVKHMNPDTDDYPEWYHYDGTLVRPGEKTDRGTIPSTPENWEKRQRKLDEIRSRKEL